jgi:hypothetical protein
MDQKTTGEKKPYQTPRLKEYGQVHRVTLSTGMANGDAGQGMMS